MTHNIVIIMGAQGSGKGTIARMLGDVQPFLWIETGKILREINPDTELGQHVANTINSGNLITDDLLFQILTPILRNDCDMLFDGFPRSIPQAEWFFNWIQNQSNNFNAKVVYLDIPEHITYARIQARLKTGNPRKDDKSPDAIARRLAIYTDRTQPLINWYRARDDVEFIEIDGTPSPEKVLADVIKKLNLPHV